MKVVHIPRNGEEERIGSAFNNLFSVINSTESCEVDTVEWDFGGISFFHPFFLASLSIYKNKCEKKILYKNMPSGLSNYVSIINFEQTKKIDAGDDLEALLQTYACKTYTPICKFSPKDDRTVDALQAYLQKLIRRQSKYDDSINTPLSYMLSEIVCNIGQHSESDYGYIYSQYLSREGVIDLCIADDGITIYGSYVNSKKYLGKIGDNEALALKCANNGFSTKNLAETRGFGLPTTRKMLVEGMHGAFFELSGGAFYRYEGISEDYVLLPKSIYWRGTIILMRIPTKVGKDFNFYDYIE